MFWLRTPSPDSKASELEKFEFVGFLFDPRQDAGINFDSQALRMYWKTCSDLLVCWKKRDRRSLSSLIERCKLTWMERVLYATNTCGGYCKKFMVKVILWKCVHLLLPAFRVIHALHSDDNVCSCWGVLQDISFLIRSFTALKIETAGEETRVLSTSGKRKMYGALFCKRNAASMAAKRLMRPMRFGVVGKEK